MSILTELSKKPKYNLSISKIHGIFPYVIYSTKINSIYIVERDILPRFDEYNECLKVDKTGFYLFYYEMGIYHEIRISEELLLNVDLFNEFIEDFNESTTNKIILNQQLNTSN